jgi:hypothetical protein
MSHLKIPDELRRKYIIGLNVKFLSYFGFLVDYSSLAPGRKKYFYRLLQHIVLVVHILFFVGSVIETTRVTGNLKVFIECLFGISVITKAMIKFRSLYSFEKVYIDMMHKFEDYLFIHSRPLTPSEKTLIESRLNLSRRLTLCIWFSCFPMISVMLVNVTPATENDVEENDHFQPAWISPSRFSIPFQSSRSPFYLLRVTYATVVAVIAILMMVMTNTFFLLVIMYTTMQFTLLAHSFRNTVKNVTDILDLESNYKGDLLTS